MRAFLSPPLPRSPPARARRALVCGLPPWAASASRAHGRPGLAGGTSRYLSRCAGGEFFEGWFIRLVTPCGRSLALILSIDTQSGGKLQVLDSTHTLHARDVPAHGFLGSPSSSVFAAHECASPRSFYEVRRDGMRGAVRDVVWDVRWAETLGWGRRGRSVDTGTWATRWGRVDPGWQVLLAGAVVREGFVRVDERVVDVRHAHVYVEKNWGVAFPRKWWWLTANHWTREHDLALTAVGAVRRTRAGGEEVVALVGVAWRGEFWEFANWNARCIQWQVAWGRWQVHAHSRNGWRVHVVASTDHDGVGVYGPGDTGMERNCRDCVNARVDLALWKDDVLVAQKVSHAAQVEIGGQWAHAETWKETVQHMGPLAALVNAFHRPGART